MTRKLRPVEAELDEEIRDAILSLPVKLSDGTLATVGDLVRHAEESLRVANEAIQNNALIATTAAFLMKQEKRRGNPTIHVRLDGSAVLRITYGEEDEEEEVVLPEAPTAAKKSKLPTLDELRDRAERMRVDISDLGRKKIEILKRLDEAEKLQEGGVTPLEQPLHAASG